MGEDPVEHEHQVHRMQAGHDSAEVVDINKDHRPRPLLLQTYVYMCYICHPTYSNVYYIL